MYRFGPVLTSVVNSSISNFFNVYLFLFFLLELDGLNSRPTCPLRDKVTHIIQCTFPFFSLLKAVI